MADRLTTRQTATPRGARAALESAPTGATSVRRCRSCSSSRRCWSSRSSGGMWLSLHKADIVRRPAVLSASATMSAPVRRQDLPAARSGTRSTSC